MRIIEAGPITKLPLAEAQILSYYSAKKLVPGALIQVPLGRRKKVPAVVFSCHGIKERKMELKDARYQLRSITGIINPDAVLSPKKIEIARLLSKYYFTPLGLFLKTLLPPKFENLKFKFQISKTRQIIHLTPDSLDLKRLETQYKKNDTAILPGKTPKQSTDAWLAVATGRKKVILGNRQAVFAPANNVFRIIVEDEQSANYKSQDQHPKFNSKKVAEAVLSGKKNRLIFKSSVPSVETFYGAQNKKIILDINKPSISPNFIKIINLREKLKKDFAYPLSVDLKKHIENSLNKKQQVILFVGRRGSSTSVWCRDCGHIFKCPRCDAPLVYHKGAKLSMICHHCGYQETPPELCVICKGHNVHLSGAGAQKVTEEVNKAFPKAKTLVLDTDVAPKTARQLAIISAFKKKQSDILIGTHLMLSHEPGPVGLVGIVNADSVLHFPDYKSSERLWQLLHKLKALSNETMLIQTFFSNMAVFKLFGAGDFEKFYKQEIQQRQILNYPPFCQLIKLSHEHAHASVAAQNAALLFKRLEQLKDRHKIKDTEFQLLGPAPAFLAKFKNKYRYNIIIKSKLSDINLRNRLLGAVPKEWSVDVDPETII